MLRNLLKLNLLILNIFSLNISAHRVHDHSTFQSSSLKVKSNQTQQIDKTSVRSKGEKVLQPYQK